jgi:hypothetical protein
MMRLSEKWPLLAFAVFLITASAPSAYSDTPLKDPGIPDGETSSYRVTTDEETSIVRESIAVRDELGRGFYEMSIRSETEEVVVRIDKETMIPFFVHTVTKKRSHTSETTTRVDFGSPVESNDIILLGMADLRYILRGFPFHSTETYYIKPLDALEGEETPFAMKVKRVKEETLEVGGRKIDCYKLQLRVAMSGIFSVINGLIPRSHFWYSVAEPHYLVAYETSGGSPGASAGRGSKSRAEIIEYSSW